MDNTYGLGGTEVRLDANEAIQEIPQNKTLLIEKLSGDTPVKPEIHQGMKTIEEVFEHFKPSVEVEFENAQGESSTEKMEFKNLGDFGLKGITNKSEFLKDLTMQKEQFQKIMKQLKTNKILKAALTDEEAKTALISAIQGLINELNEAG